ncbi:MAG: hypothetical protein WC532_04120 [Candidatus Omnitrophota bacterium]
MTKWILSFAICFCCLVTEARAASDYAGERVVFAISPMGMAEYNDLGMVELEGRQVNLVTFRTRTVGFDDTEKIYSDPATFLPLRVERDILLPIGKEYLVEEYDPEKFTLEITKFKDGKETKVLSFAGDGPVHNAILLPFSLRRIPDLYPGWKMDILLPDKFEVTMAAIEKISVPAGTFSAYHFVSSPPKFEIWISADSMKLPLKIKDTGGLGYTLLIKEHDQKK